jgi:hypothetical protein
MMDRPICEQGFTITSPAPHNWQQSEWRLVGEPDKFVGELLISSAQSGPRVDVCARPGCGAIRLREEDRG